MVSRRPVRRHQGERTAFRSCAQVVVVVVVVLVVVVGRLAGLRGTLRSMKSGEKDGKELSRFARYHGKKREEGRVGGGERRMERNDIKSGRRRANSD